MADVVIGVDHSLSRTILNTVQKAKPARLNFHWRLFAELLEE